MNRIVVPNQALQLTAGSAVFVMFLGLWRVLVCRASFGKPLPQLNFFVRQLSDRLSTIHWAKHRPLMKNWEFVMQQIIADKNQLKEVFKQALAELLQEQRDLLYDVFAEVLEDIAMVNAIKEGEATAIVSRKQVFEILESES